MLAVLARIEQPVRKRRWQSNFIAFHLKGKGDRRIVPRPECMGYDPAAEYVAKINGNVGCAHGSPGRGRIPADEMCFPQVEGVYVDPEIAQIVSLRIAARPQVEMIRDVAVDIFDWNCFVGSAADDVRRLCYRDDSRDRL